MADDFCDGRRQHVFAGPQHGGLKEARMTTLESKDGTMIAFDRQGDGPALILVDGAMGTRSSGSKPELAKRLAQRLTVYTYDRRGRGDSGDTKPYAVDREIEDIEILIDKAGGSAFCTVTHPGHAWHWMPPSNLATKSTNSPCTKPLTTTTPGRRRRGPSTSRTLRKPWRPIVAVTRSLCSWRTSGCPPPRLKGCGMRPSGAGWRRSPPPLPMTIRPSWAKTARFLRNGRLACTFPLWL